MIELFNLLLFHGIYVFLGGIIIISIISDFIVKLIKELLRPFRHDTYYIDNVKKDNVVVEIKKEVDDE